MGSEQHEPPFLINVDAWATLPAVVRCASEQGLDSLAFAEPVLTFEDAIDAMADPAPKLVFRAA